MEGIKDIVEETVNRLAEFVACDWCPVTDCIKEGHDCVTDLTAYVMKEGDFNEQTGSN